MHAIMRARTENRFQANAISGGSVQPPSPADFREFCSNGPSSGASCQM